MVVEETEFEILRRMPPSLIIALGAIAAAIAAVTGWAIWEHHAGPHV